MAESIIGLNAEVVTALNCVVSAEGILDNLFHEGALDYLPHDSTYDGLRTLCAQLSTARQALGAALYGARGCSAPAQ